MNPYSALPDVAFWRQSVANRSMFDISGLWNPKLDLRNGHKVATFGSCFAQHIGSALAARGYGWLNTEPAPFGLSGASARRYNYNVFSCRTANIYTASLLRQWVAWALKKASPPGEYWEKDGQVRDPFRPTIEPDGFKSVAEMTDSRAVAIDAFRRAIEEADVFVFTLGLTESWFSRAHGQEYPLCPGTAAGEFSAENHEFRNQQFGNIRTSLLEALEWMHEVNPRLQVILTVSPVPLTATHSGRHVLVATVESKSILRAVAGELGAAVPWIDYFPSYEIICSPPFRGIFYEPNLRTINPRGVEFVMDSFFDCLRAKYGAESLPEPGPDGRDGTPDQADPVCDEEMLAAFGDR